MFLEADTLKIYERDKKDSLKSSTPQKDDLSHIVAQKKVKVFKSDFQSVSDSMFYDYSGGKINFHKSPILWNLENQLEADTVFLLLKEEALDQMKLRSTCFVIEKDTLGNYNQIKGRKMDAKFAANTNFLERIDVYGNGESNFFALDESFKVIGLNKVQCGKMSFNFGEKQIKQVVFKAKPESLLIPPKEISKEDLYLEGFKWKIEQRPTRATMLSNPENKRLQEAKRLIFQ
jgi:hypothetical protein